MAGRQQELLSLLQTPIPSSRAPIYRKGVALPRGPRCVYRTKGYRNNWCVDYASELPAFEPFDDEDVFALKDAGLIEKTFEGCDEMFNLKERKVSKK